MKVERFSILAISVVPLCEASLAQLGLAHLCDLIDKALGPISNANVGVNIFFFLNLKQNFVQ